MTDIVRPRRRPRAVAAEAASQAEGPTLAALMEAAWAAKVAADDAENLYKKTREALLAKMREEKRTEFDLPAAGERPGIKATITAKTTNVIDPMKFANMVTRAQFAECVTVGIGKAKQYVAEGPLKKITTPIKGTEYVDLRKAGRSRD